jgi:rRNA maturation RNase YbeY
VTNRSGALRAPRRSRLEAALGAAAEIASRRFGRSRAERRPTVGVVWAGDREMRSLNRRFGGGEESTDVLAFPQGVDGAGIEADRLGEIVCNLELARRECRAHGNPAEAEAVLYATHGLVHLLGGRDGTPRDRRAMREVEIEALARAGLEVRGGEWDLVDRPQGQEWRSGGTA